MIPFQWITAYDPSFELRDWTSLVTRVQLQPSGLFRPLLGARRSGKTWALAALASAIGDRAVVVDLSRHDQLPPIGEHEVVLVDEPSRWIFRAASVSEIRHRGREPDPAAISALFRWCRGLVDRKIAITVALTPAEWAALADAGARDGSVDRRELEHRRLGPLDRATARQMARTDPACQLFDALPERWTRSPFLLGLVLNVAFDEPGGFAPPLPDERMAELLELAIEHARSTARWEHDFHVLHESLTVAQRAIVRAVCRGQPIRESDDARLLNDLGLIWRRADGYEAGDPVLASILPSPVRIHHISDLHFGPKAADRIDAKAKDRVGQKLASGAGQGAVVDDYLDWLRANAVAARPNLLIVSGDVAEFAKPDEYEQARPWLEKVAAELAPHPDLRDGDPRVLLVPGNHDVDWGAPPSRNGERLRHLPFARAFGDLDWPRPLLEQPPGSRSVAGHLFADADLAVLLLGSCEYGGERGLDVQQLAGEALQRAEAAGDLARQITAKTIEGAFGRQDPGFVHDEDIQAVRQHTWRGKVRIAVLHHPLSPIPDIEIAPYAGLLNAGWLKDVLLDKGFCLALHGHVHSPWVATERWHRQGRTLLICSARTLGSSQTLHGHGFNEIRILREAEQFEVEVRPFERVGRSFVADGAPVRITID